MSKIEIVIAEVDFTQVLLKQLQILADPDSSGNRQNRAVCVIHRTLKAMERLKKKQ